MISFIARGRFTQVAPEENHHRAFCCWYDALEVEQLFRDVRDEVNQLHEHLNRRKTEELSERVDANVTEVANVQRAVHLLELVIFPIYIVELWVLLRKVLHEEELRKLETPPAEWSDLLRTLFNVEVLVVFALALAGTFLVVEWHWLKSLLEGKREED